LSSKCHGHSGLDFALPRLRITRLDGLSGEGFRVFEPSVRGLGQETMNPKPRKPGLCSGFHTLPTVLTGPPTRTEKR
jgi:hypothetical protein